MVSRIEAINKDANLLGRMHSKLLKKMNELIGGMHFKNVEEIGIAGNPCMALCMDERGIPATAEERVEVCKKVLERCWEREIEDVYFDPLVLPISINDKNGMTTLKTLEILKSMGVKTTSGLTNISYGLPRPSNIEVAFLALAFRYSDSVILNPLDEAIIVMIRACEAVIGRDRFCRGYLRAYR